ncbi:hypothetical protein EDB84DRAFT_1443106 [Lactarius hengduanensis]|nr:hypothetical protein EDB84DRAFT_1443106 [Lactarius hengduanensis]
MRGVFQKRLENDSADGSSPPPSPLTPTASPSLIPKPSGEVGRVGRGGYTLRDILEQQHGWEDGLYQKIRIFLRKGAQKAKKDQQQKDKEPEAKGKARVMPPGKYDLTLDSAESRCNLCIRGKDIEQSCIITLLVTQSLDSPYELKLARALSRGRHYAPGKASRSGRDRSKMSPDRVAMLRRTVKMASFRSEWAICKEHLGLVRKLLFARVWGHSTVLEFGIGGASVRQASTAREQNERPSRREYKRLRANTPPAHHHPLQPRLLV